MLAPSAGSVWSSSISGSTSRQCPADPSHTSAISWSISLASMRYPAKPTRARAGIPLCRAETLCEQSGQPLDAYKS